MGVLPLQRKRRPPELGAEEYVGIESINGFHLQRRVEPKFQKRPPKTVFPDDEPSTRATVPIANRYSAYCDHILKV